MKLIEILEKFNLDVNFSNSGYGSGGTDKNSCHSYIENFYEEEFEKYKNREVSLLEIGVETGGSLKLWKEYFANSKSIVGLDISEDKIDYRYRNIPGVSFYICNAYDEENLKNFGDFDIIIDDGPHTLESQLKCIELYLPKLKKDGLFIIEDVQDMEHFNLLIEKTKKVSKIFDNNIQYVVECIDLRDKKQRWDDLIFLIRT